MQSKCNKSAKIVTPCKFHIIILGCDWLKDNRKFSKPTLSCKMMTTFCAETLKKIFSNEKKMASRKIFQHFLHMNSFILMLISNHMVLLINMELIHACEFFIKLKLHLQINSKLNSKWYDYLYKCYFYATQLQLMLTRFESASAVFLSVTEVIARISSGVVGTCHNKLRRPK